MEHVMRHHEMRGSKRPLEDFYERTAILGQGAFGKVTKWRTKFAGDGCSTEEVAIKHIGWKAAWHSYWPDKSQLEELQQELKMLVILDCPFIINVREWFEHPWKGIFFVMELCEGGSLQDLLEDVVDIQDKDERLQYEPRFRRHFREMTYALAYLHSMDPPIVHRDLKPDNALMKTRHPESCVKLIDFGLTILSDDRLSTDESWRKGTQVFMAPEQFLEPPGKFTESMDIWALGIILGWMVSAVHLGSLQHTMLEEQEGQAFRVTFYSLHFAYKDFKEGIKSWNSALFSAAPAAVIDLMGRILVCEPEERLYAKDIIDHEWTATGDPAKQAMLMDHTSLLHNISTYHDLDKFEKIVLNLVASRAESEAIGSNVGDRIVSMRRMFRGLDKSNTGYLSEDELKEGFRRFHTDPYNPVSDELIGKIYAEMDVDGSGRVDYTEFLAAGIGSAILCDKDSVSSAFRGLDSKNRGKIYKQDLVDAMGEEPAERLCAKQDKNEFTYTDFQSLVEEIAAKRWAIPTCTELDGTRVSQWPSPQNSEEEEWLERQISAERRRASV